MYNITLICTKHHETGNCNSAELLKIIERYNPEIIFEEISIAVYDQCYGIMDRNTLETSAVKMYLVKKKIKHIPVVGAELSDDFLNKLEIMTKNLYYRYLIDKLLSLEERYGFTFLNSKKCCGLYDRMNALEKLIMNELNYKKLNSIVQLSDAAVDKYENEIISNVYEYSKHNKYKKALLFMGAAHKKSITRKIGEYNKHENFKLNWSFYGET